MIRLENVSVHFGGVRALQDVSLDVGDSRLVGLIGPNGAGKSTLLAVLTGDVRPTSGRVIYEGRDIRSVSPHRRCRLGICRTHQVPRPLRGMTVYENILVGKTFGGRSRAEDGLSIEELLDITGLSGQGDRLVDELGPSDLRLLELARAAATSPRILLVDEIAAGLPTDRIPEITNVLRSFADRGITLIVVEHVIAVVVALVEKLFVLDNGSLLAEGEPQQVLNDRRVIDTYFGTSITGA